MTISENSNRDNPASEFSAIEHKIKNKRKEWSKIESKDNIQRYEKENISSKITVTFNVRAISSSKKNFHKTTDIHSSKVTHRFLRKSIQVSLHSVMIFLNRFKCNFKLLQWKWIVSMLDTQWNRKRIATAWKTHKPIKTITDTCTHTKQKKRCKNE